MISRKRRWCAISLIEAKDQQSVQSWSAVQELIIKTIQQEESVSRTEAIRRMQRRKKASHLAVDLPW